MKLPRHSTRATVMPAPSRFDTPDDRVIAERAAAWLTRLDGGNLSPADRAEFERWAAGDPRHREELERLRRLLGAVRQVRERRSVRAARRDALVHACVDQWRHRLAGVAALAGVAVVAWTIVWWNGADRFRTDAAGTQLITLRDGSRLHLDAGSAADVRIDDSRREITLRRGAAYVDVARDADRPFTLIAGDERITDIGTRFAVRRDAGHTEVAVEQGEVEVRRSSAGATALRIRAGYEARFRDDGDAAVGTVDPADIASWRHGRLVFIDATLAEIVSAANRHRDAKLRLADPALGTLRITAVFDLSDPAALPWALQRVLPVVAQDRGGEIVLRAAARG